MEPLTLSNIKLISNFLINSVACKFNRKHWALFVVQLRQQVILIYSQFFLFNNVYLNKTRH